MKASELLEYIQNGATLKSRYKHNTTDKLVHVLTLPNGESIQIQQSTIKPLIQSGNLLSVLWSGGIKDYVLNPLNKLPHI